MYNLMTYAYWYMQAVTVCAVLVLTIFNWGSQIIVSLFFLSFFLYFFISFFLSFSIPYLLLLSVCLLQIGSDIPEIDSTIIKNAFKDLDNEFYDSVIGQAQDGGYYLIGLSHRVKNKIGTEGGRRKRGRERGRVYEMSHGMFLSSSKFT